MRKTLLIAFATLLTGAVSRADTAQSADGLACFVNLTPPAFPKAALQGHVDGSVWTWTDVDSQGVPGKIETQVVSAWSDAEKLLKPQVEQAIHAAKVKPECAGRKVWVVFRYQLYGEPTANPKVTTRNESPNMMYIESQPELAATTSSANKAPGKH